MTDYAEVRDQMLPGDLIAFGGKGRASNIIKFFTRSVVSHVGLVRHVQMLASSSPASVVWPSMDEPATMSRYFNEIVESTSLDGISGVQTARLSRRLEKYEGEAWWLPLNGSARERFDETAYWDWLYQQDGKPYDTRQAIGAGFDFLEGIGVGLNTEDFSELFCSELGAGALREAGVLLKELRAAGRELPDPGIVVENPSEETPIQLCQRPIWKPARQLKGEPTEIW